jgi:hypothetical protein
MRHLAIAIIALGTIAVAAPAAKADSYYGPVKVGNQCWKRQIGNSLGYWTECKPAESSRAAATSSRNRR